MKTYVVSASGTVPIYCCYRVRAESEEEALRKAQAELDEISKRIHNLEATDEDYERWPDWEFADPDDVYYFIDNIVADEIWDVEEEDS